MWLSKLPPVLHIVKIAVFILCSLTSALDDVLVELVFYPFSLKFKAPSKHAAYTFSFSFQNAPIQIY